MVGAGIFSGVIVSVCLAQAAALDADQIPPPRSAVEALQSFSLHPGFEIELVASEPWVMDPVAIAWGADGRLWVVEMGDYPLGVDGQGKPGGKVVVLDDTDHDGRYDRSTTFLEGLSFPTGIFPWRTGVIISAAPEIFFAEDRDGDGRADHRETLLRGLGEGNQQHRVNGLRWGLDNWIHCANGDSGGTIVSVKTGETLNIGRRDFRFRPDDGRIEPVTGQTQFGLETDDWGHWFGSSNSRPLTHYALPEHYLRRNPHAAPSQTSREVPEAAGAAPVFPVSPALARFNDLNKVNRFTSACGCAIYRDELFGVGFEQNSFVCEPVHNLVHREVLQPHGASFVSHRADDEQRSEFLASTDPWFRPVIARTGPDGALWIVDMYRAVIEHPEWIPRQWQEKLDLRAGHDRGRIYRVYPANLEPRPIPQLVRMSPAELVEMLSDPSGTVRDLARQLIIERDDKQVVSQLRALAIRSSTPQTQVQALATLEALGGMRDSLIAQLVRDPQPMARVAALRLAEAWLARPEGEERHWTTQYEDLRQAAIHPHPMVRLQAAFTLGEVKTTSAARPGISPRDVGRLLVEIVCRDHADPFVVGAVISSLNVDNLPAVTESLLASDVENKARAALFEPLVATAVGLDSTSSLQAILQWITRGDPHSLASEQVHGLQVLLDTLDRKRRSLDQLPDELQGPLGTVRAIVALARDTAADDKSSLERRVAAVGLLGRDGARRRDDVATLTNLLAPQSPAELRSAALASLTRIGTTDIPAALLRHWASSTPSFRAQVVDALLAREVWIAPLLDAIEKGLVRPQDLQAAQVQRLTLHRNAELKWRATQLLAAAANTPRAEIVRQYQDVLPMSGDPRRGGQVFAKRCAACHRLGEVGHAVGPDLTALTDKSPSSLLVAMLDPNRAVEAKFLTYTAITVDGLTHTGMLVDESGGSLTLLAGEGKRVTLARADLDEFASNNKSLMPEGLEKDVTRQDLADLLAMLAELRPVRKRFTGNDPAVVRPEALRGEFYLLATEAEIYGSTLVYEPTFRNLGYWQSPDDHAVWTIETPAAGSFEVSFEYACPADSAGNIAQIALGEQRLSTTVKSTGGWETFGTAVLGHFNLPAGQSRIVVRADGKPRGALFDLKSVRLRPVR